MTKTQKKLCRLLELSYENGFSGFSIYRLAEHFDMSTKEVYDHNTESGYLWDFRPVAKGNLAGFLHFDDEFGFVSVCRDTLRLLEHYCDFQP